jgi:hypothetical protein
MTPEGMLATLDGGNNNHDDNATLVEMPHDSTSLTASI